MTGNPIDSYVVFKVEAAFDGSGFATPDSERTWTDISAYVELEQGIDITIGRQDEFSTADPNDLSLTLNNRDGRFTPSLASSPYYPNVTLYAPIRVTAAPVVGSATVIFRGYVDQWPLSWRDVDTDCDVKVTAHSRMARLGVSNPLPSDFVAANAGAAAYYPLSESSAATQALDQSGHAQQPLVRLTGAASPTFGADSITPYDESTSALFAGGVGGSALAANNLVLSLDNMSVAVISMSCVVQTSMTTGSADLLSVSSTDILPPQLVATLSIANGIPFFTALPVYSSGSWSATASIADGKPHVVGLDFTSTYNTGTGDWTFVGQIRVDGAVVATGTISNILYGLGVSFAFTVGSAGFAGYLAQVALRDTAANWSALTGALSGYAGETTGARFVRYAQQASVPAAEINASGCSTLLQGVDAANDAVVEALRNEETSEGGVMWDRPDGFLELQSRGHRYAASSKFTLDMAKGHIDDYEPELDSTMLVNQVTVANGDGTVTQTVSDPTSIDLYGVESQSITTYASDPDEPWQRASWIVSSYKDPKPRVATLSVDLLLATVDGPTLATLLSASVGDLFTVINQPLQAMAATSRYFIEGYQDSIDETGWTRVYNVSDATMWLDTFVFDDPVRGVLDAGYRLAY